MQRTALLVLFALAAAMLFAQDSDSSKKGKQMSGTVCDASCVVQQSNTATCDPQCTTKSGQCVLVGDKGHVMKISNPEKAMPHMGKHVTAMVEPTAEQREEAVRIMELYDQAP
jgi:hypothetical protein